MKHDQGDADNRYYVQYDLNLAYGMTKDNVCITIRWVCIR